MEMSEAQVARIRGTISVCQITSYLRHDPLAGTMDRVVLEFSLPEQWAQRDLLREIPDGIEVAAGIVDVKNPQIETAAEIREKAEALLRHVPAGRLLLCPSCGFGRRDVPMAIGKVIAMVQAAQRIGG